MEEANGGVSPSVAPQKPVAHVRPMLAASTPSPTTSPSPSPKQHVLQVQRPALVHTVRAKKCRFVRNGDRFFRGVHLAVNLERFRNFDSLLAEVTRLLQGTECMPLPSGVRTLYSTKNGIRVTSAEDLKDGEIYACASAGELYKKTQYGQVMRKPRHLSPHLSKVPEHSPCSSDTGTSVRPRLIVIVRSGNRPRRVVRVLINKRNSPSFEVALNHMTEYVKLDTGAVRKLFTLEGKQVQNLEDLMACQSGVFIAYGTERHSRDDFELDLEEYKSLQSLTKSTGRRVFPPALMTMSVKPIRKFCGSAEQLSRSCSPLLRTSLMKKPPPPKPKMPRKTKTTAKKPPVASPPPSEEPDSLPETVAREYEAGRIIGDGNFAVVKECVLRKTGEYFALKIIDKDKCKGKEHMIASEVAILRRVRHPNIVHLYAEFDFPRQLYLVMELVKGGDLFDAIAAANKFNERDAATMTRHLCSALSYLHQRRIVHRDIKPENLLVDVDESGCRILKLGDFGLAQEITEPLYMVCGTPTYVAPEILAETGYGLKVDIWAAGVILYILLCGFPPFVSASNDQEELFDVILSGIFEFPSPYWDPISDSARELVASMLQPDQSLRFSAEDVLDHPWLSECYSSDDEASLQLYHRLGVRFELSQETRSDTHLSS
ncbi:serine/threonine-protein kinase DCLK1 isoform X2 [Neocloeon triangulifer]|uniref:serine/threonine-protein kinase DCLK1 isoform X2 n=1 Tax=Neocloeon triangulifer TaxID=2078957 RepID=UPI00286EE058|nr:serine/threonine-protein kinase DCLK1 isoform X2 [Neocloeon triangulifer]